MSEFRAKLGSNPQDFAALIVAACGAVACACMALFIDTASWAAWFHHPGREPMPDVTVQGAKFCRLMLCVTAIVLAFATLALMRLNRGDSIATIETAENRRRLRWLLGIVIVALLFRATRLNEGLWYDEIASWMTYSAGLDSPGPVIGNFRDPINQAFHTLLNFYSVRWFADWIDIELAFRLPALLFSVISVIAMFGLARTVSGERVAMIAALLMAILPVSVLEGIEARGYSMMICFSALMTWMLIEARRRQRTWIWILYSIFCALGIWSHFVTVYVPIGHAVWIAWRAIFHRELKFAISALLALALGAILTLTLYAPMIPDMLSARGMFAAVNPGQPRVFSIEGLHALLQLGGSWYPWTAMPGLILLIIGMLSLRNRARENASVVAASLIGLPLMLLTVILSGSWVYARFTFFALPGAILLIALGIDALWNRSRRAGIAAIALIVIASITDLAIRPPKQPLRNAATFVRDHLQTNDRIIIIGLAHPVMRLYINDLNPRYVFRHGEDLERQLDRINPAWVIIEYPRHVDESRYALMRDRGYQHVETFRGWADWVHGDVLVLRRNFAP